MKVYGLSQSPFGFWGEWNNIKEAVEEKEIVSQSPFGFWGEWNTKEGSLSMKIEY